MQIKISGLGLCASLNIDEFLEAYAGTPHFMAPEMRNHNSYNYKIDVWSLGILFYRLLTG